MTRQEAADYLEYYNNWRRDNNTPSIYKHPCPTKLGKVIELAIKELRKND